MSSSTATTTTTAGSAPVDRFPLRGPGTSVPGPLVVRAAAPRAVPGGRWGLERTHGRGAERGRDVAASGKDPRTRDAPIGRGSRLPASVTDAGCRTRTARSGFRGLDAGVRGRTGGGRMPEPEASTDGRSRRSSAGRAAGFTARRADARVGSSTEADGGARGRTGCTGALLVGRGGAAQPHRTKKARAPGGLGPSGGGAAQVPSVPRYRPITAGSSMSSRPVPV